MDCHVASRLAVTGVVRRRDRGCRFAPRRGGGLMIFKGLVTGWAHHEGYREMGARLLWGGIGRFGRFWLTRSEPCGCVQTGC